MLAGNHQDYESAKGRKTETFRLFVLSGFRDFHVHCEPTKFTDVDAGIQPSLAATTCPDETRYRMHFTAQGVPRSKPVFGHLPRDQKVRLTAP